MGTLTITIDRKTGKRISEEYVEDGEEPDYAPLAAFFAELMLEEHRKEMVLKNADQKEG